jgi:hypothetical protein
MARVAITKDNVSKVVKGITELVGKRVLVGVPEDAAARKGDDDHVNNATIGYAMEFGQPEHNVPARPHLIPGVQKAEKPAVAQLRKAADATLNGDSAKADQFLNAAGIIGANEVRGMINSNIPPALSPETIRRRKYTRGTKSRRESEDVYLDLVSKGVTPEAAQGETGIISLVNTAQYRNAITSVVRKK